MTKRRFVPEPVVAFYMALPPEGYDRCPPASEIITVTNTLPPPSVEPEAARDRRFVEALAAWQELDEDARRDILAYLRTRRQEELKESGQARAPSARKRSQATADALSAAIKVLEGTAP